MHTLFFYYVQLCFPCPQIVQVSEVGSCNQGSNLAVAKNFGVVLEPYHTWKFYF